MNIKQKASCLLLLCCALNSTTAQVRITPEAEQRAKALVEKMTLEEKIDYISGVRSFYIRAIPRLGIPEIRMAVCLHMEQGTGKRIRKRTRKRCQGKRCKYLVRPRCKHLPFTFMRTKF